MPYTIGIDFGGVLSQHNQDESQIEHINTAIDMPYAVESLQTLKSDGHALHIVSYCGKKRARESLESLEQEKLSYLFDSQNYVKSRMYKAYLCSYLGCHIMIDDRKDVLDNIKLQTPHIETIWFGSSDPSIHHCGPTWLDVIRIVRGLDLQPVNPNTSVPVSRYMHVLCPDYTEF